MTAEQLGVSGGRRPPGGNLKKEPLFASRRLAVLGTVVTLLISLSALPAWAPTSCENWDGDVQATYRTDLGEYVLDTWGGRGIQEQRNSSDGAGYPGGEVIRSIYVADGPALFNFVEWGWYKDYGDTSYNLFLVRNIDGVYYEDAKGTISSGTRTWKLAYDPDASVWKYFYDSTLVGQVSHAYLDEGLLGTLSERKNLCDDNHSKWTSLYYKQAPLGGYVPWGELGAQDDDVEYDCFKATGSNDSEWFSREGPYDSWGPAGFCLPDADVPYP